MLSRRCRRIQPNARLVKVPTKATQGNFELPAGSPWPVTCLRRSSLSGQGGVGFRACARGGPGQREVQSILAGRQESGGIDPAAAKSDQGLGASDSVRDCRATVRSRSVAPARCRLGDSARLPARMLTCPPPVAGRGTRHGRPCERCRVRPASGRSNRFQIRPPWRAHDVGDVPRGVGATAPRPPSLTLRRPGPISSLRPACYPSPRRPPRRGSSGGWWPPWPAPAGRPRASPAPRQPAGCPAR